jgi:serine/threonine protein kinase
MDAAPRRREERPGRALMATGETPDLDRIGTASEESFFRDVPVERERASSRSIPPLRIRGGDTLEGRFAIERIVGGGGMAAVFRAVDLTDGQVVAIKVLEKRMYADRFAREGEILSSLSHPGIVRYVADGITPEGAPFLAMEWLEGEDLAHRLTRARLSIEQSVRLARRASEALAAAHATGIVHRDVKPNNLFLVGGDPDRIKVVDFGVARLDGNALSQRGDVIGTPGYMAPEQALAEDDVDPSADVFALGCVLFECLTGSPAFKATHPLAVLAEEPPRLSVSRPELGFLDPLLGRVLAKDRAARPQNGQALCAELTSIEQESHLGAG